MVKTRQTAKPNGDGSSKSKPQDESTIAGAKRKADTNGSPASKKGAKEPVKKQKTIEQTMLGEDEFDDKGPTDAEMQKSAEVLERDTNNGDTTSANPSNGGSKDDNEPGENAKENEAVKTAEEPDDTVMSEANDNDASKLPHY